LIQLKAANRGKISALRRRDQIGPAAPVTFRKGKTDANQAWDLGAVPAGLPPARLTLSWRTPVCEIEALYASDQLGLDRLGRRCGRLLMSVRYPAQNEPPIAELKRDFRATARAQTSRKVTHKRQLI